MALDNGIPIFRRNEERVVNLTPVYPVDKGKVSANSVCDPDIIVRGLPRWCRFGRVSLVAGNDTRAGG
jgi:hypothetical protein